VESLLAVGADVDNENPVSYSLFFHEYDASCDICAALGTSSDENS